jgi:hypothetical protein
MERSAVRGTQLKYGLVILVILCAPAGVVSAQEQNYVVLCPPMAPPLAGPYRFDPRLQLFQEGVEQAGSLYVKGVGFTVNNTARVVVSITPNSSLGYVFDLPTDRDGVFFNTVIVGNLSLGYHRVVAFDLATGTITQTLLVKLLPSSKLTTVLNGRHFTWSFHHPDWYSTNLNEVTQLAHFADDVYDNYSRDFGFTIGSYSIQVTNEADNMTGLYLAFASVNTIVMSANLLDDDYSARSFLTHEMANLFQGNVTGGWPWTDGQGMWRQLTKYGEPASPFPYAASAKVLYEVGDADYAAKKIAGVAGDCGFSLLWSIFQKFGWTPYRGLFGAIRQNHVDLTQYSDEAKTAIIPTLMSTSTGYDFVSLFNATFNERNESIRQSTISTTYYSIYNSLPKITDLQDTGILVGGRSVSGVSTPRSTESWLSRVWNNMPTISAVLFVIVVAIVAAIFFRRRRLSSKREKPGVLYQLRCVALF